LKICRLCRNVSNNLQKSVINTSKLKLFRISAFFLLAFVVLYLQIQHTKSMLNYRSFSMPYCCSIQSLKTIGLRPRPVAFETGMRPEIFETEAHKIKSRNSSRDRDQVSRLHHCQWRSQAKNLGEDKMFDFRRITLFCLEKCLSKHKMTIFSENFFGGMAPLPPWLRLWSLLDRVLKGYAVQGFRDARDEYLIVCPLPISSIEKYKKCRHRETNYPDLCYVQKDYTTKMSPQVRIKNRKLYESRTTLRNNSKAT